MAFRSALLTLLLAVSGVVRSDTKLITFVNPTIHLLDGVSFMIDGFAVHNMLVVVKKTSAIHIGKPEGKKLVGLYKFNQENYSVHQLAKIESQFPNNAQLNKLLAQAKHDFMAITKPFTEDISTAKKLILSLIYEFCERRNRHDSTILSWANCRPGGEEEVFNSQIHSFADFDLFLGDLILFLKDLIHSCPKACEQYKEWYKQKM